MVALRRVLEIGHGGSPMANTRNKDIRRFSWLVPAGTIYHGIDCPEHCEGNGISNWLRAETVREFEKRHRSCKPENVFLHRMDGRSLGFRPGVFDEVHLHDIVHDPRVLQEDVQRMMDEAHRVMKSGGMLIITGMEGKIFEASVGNAGFAMQTTGFRNLAGTDLFDATAFGPMIEEGYGDYRWFAIIAEK